MNRITVNDSRFTPSAEVAGWQRWIPFEFFLEKAWSDGFPVVTPTEERVQWMLAGTRRDPDELIGRVPPALEPATVRTAAIHALMAGCKPEYLPVVLGALAIILREEFNMGGVQCTMHGVAPLMIVNGPYAQRDRAARRQRLLRARLPRQRHDRPRDPPDAAQSRRRHRRHGLRNGVSIAAYATRRASPSTWRAVPGRASRCRAAMRPRTT